VTAPPRDRTLDTHEAVADVASRLSEVIAIHPITPASAMGEHADAVLAHRARALAPDAASHEGARGGSLRVCVSSIHRQSPINGRTVP
jgi:hypothetical protein